MTDKTHKSNDDSSTNPAQKDWEAISNQAIENDVKEDVSADQQEDDEEASHENQGAIEHPSYTVMEEKLTAAEQLAEKNNNNYLSECAAHANTRKRLERDIQNAYKYSVEKVLQECLPIIDCLEKSLETKTETSDSLKQIRDGVEMTLSMFADLLQKQGVKVIDPLGEKFDPTHHEAMSTQPSDEAEPNTVLIVFQKGYLLHNRLVRPARVIVAKEAE